MSAVALAVRHEPRLYESWAAWRAWRAHPTSVHVHEQRSTCAWCMGAGRLFEVVRRRTDDLAHDVPDVGRIEGGVMRRFPDRPHHALVACANCRGTGVIEKLLAVLAGDRRA